MRRDKKHGREHKYYDAFGSLRLFYVLETEKPPHVRLERARSQRSPHNLHQSHRVEQTGAGSYRAQSFSAGVAAFDAGDREILPMLETIDHALYRAKADGRDRVRMAAHTHVPWNSALLRQVVAENRVRQASQAIVDLQTGRVIADEALARIETATGETIKAKDFVDMAEGLGLMAEIDRQVVRGVMERCVARLNQGGVTDFAHFVNVSPQFLARHDLVEEMLGNAVEFCRTCSVTPGPVKPIVDDFGSGYSSYLYLAHLPVSFL